MTSIDAPVLRGLERIVPPELVARFVDFLELGDLLQAMAVNKRWRYLALDHPTYWRDLSLDHFQSMQSAYVRLFRLRLARSHGRPINVFVSYLPNEPGELQILPDIAQHISHMQHLEYISGDDEIHDALFDALAHPAPILRTLHLSAHTYDPVAIRADLLSGVAPELRKVTIANLDLPLPIPPCLRAVEWLSLLKASVPDLSQDFPRLRELRLCRRVTLNPAFLEERVWRGIQVLWFDGGDLVREWHRRRLPIARVPQIIVRIFYQSGFTDPGAAASLAALAAHVNGTVSVHVVWQAPDELRIDLRGTPAACSALERGVIVVDHQFPNSESPVAFPGNDLAAGFADRVVYLSAGLASWDVALCLGDLPALETLVLLLNKHEPTPENPGQLSCPRLRRVILRGGLRREIVAIDLEPLMRFAQLALVGAPFPPVVELQRVELLPVEHGVESESPAFRGPTPTDFSGDHRWL